MSICVSNPDEIAAELKMVVLNRKEDGSTVKKIADILGLSQRTVYDYLDSRLKVNLKFIQACLIATNGDRDVKKFLCPEGWEGYPLRKEYPVVGLGQREVDFREDRSGRLNLIAQQTAGNLGINLKRPKAE